MADFPSPAPTNLLDQWGNPIANQSSGGANYSPAPVPYSSTQNPSTLWNTAWNQGYNNAINQGNPYAGQVVGGYDLGQGYTLGQQAYKANMPGGGSPSGGSSGGGSISTDASTQNQFNLPWEQLNEWQRNQITSADDRARNEINAGYGGYFGQLDAMLGELPNQVKSQQDIVNAQYNTGVGQLGSQRTQGLADLASQTQKTNANQVKNLTDLAEAMRNNFISGNVLLGARGAGDSSAANQYSYALTKLGNKQRGDIVTQTQGILNDINDREFKLNTIYNEQLNTLGSERDQKIAGIAQWFSEAKNQIAQLRGQGELSKGKDLASLTQNALNYAMQQLQQVQTQYANSQTALQQWAINQSSNIKELKSNLSNISNFQPTLPAFQGLGGLPYTGGNSQTNYFPGSNSSSEDKNSLFSFFGQ